MDGIGQFKPVDIGLAYLQAKQIGTQSRLADLQIQQEQQKAQQLQALNDLKLKAAKGDAASRAIVTRLDPEYAKKLQDYENQKTVYYGSQAKAIQGLPLSMRNEAYNNLYKKAQEAGEDVSQFPVPDDEWSDLKEGTLDFLAKASIEPAKQMELEQESRKIAKGGYGNRPAVLQIADELYSTSGGKITRQNAILMAGKFLNKENVVNPETGEVEKLGGSLVATKQTKEAESAGKKIGELETEREFNAPKAQSSMEAAFAKNDNVVKLIDETVPKVTPLTAGFGGAVLSKVPGSDARDLQKQVKSIVANLGFDELQEMRANSPTGGALGQIAVQEIQYLQAVKANLEQDQSPAQLRKNLESAKKQVLASKRRIKAAYEREYKGQSNQTNAETGGTVDYKSKYGLE